ncbi:hypothetical protein [Brevibacillus laterosporus]|uniref:hypothetical protein n=1 Tax=Brevibacillus laterosporus TaxID=1465 RepID=UPI00215BC45E|nr:hypothetical protein [Brevibacillus laterosporus]MCR8997432.1 hypothetical protein [Brevibacillus laterosporus]
MKKHLSNWKSHLMVQFIQLNIPQQERHKILVEIRFPLRPAFLGASRRQYVLVCCILGTLVAVNDQTNHVFLHLNCFPKSL